MTEQALIEQRDRLLDQIVDAHLLAEMPGESDTMQFARTLTRSALLGRLEPLPFAGPAVVRASLPPADVSISPDPLVETAEACASPDLPEHPGCGVPGRPTGETPEEESVETSPPVTPVSAVPANVPGSSGAIFEARVYVLNCIEKRHPVSSRVVENLTGWDKPQAQKFVRELMDEAQRKGRVPSGKAQKKQRIEAGFTAIAAAIAAAGDLDDEEPDDDELAEVEEAASPVLTAANGNLPPWLSDSSARYCKKCLLMIQPQRVGAKQHWQGKVSYEQREYCSRACYQATRKAK